MLSKMKNAYMTTLVWSVVYVPVSLIIMGIAGVDRLDYVVAGWVAAGIVGLVLDSPLFANKRPSPDQRA